MILMWVLALFAGIYIVAIIEQWSISGRVRLNTPFLSALSLFGRESLTPRERDKVLFETAPLLLLIAPLAASVVLPFAKDSVLIDLATGALFVNAALIYVLVALFMAGWGPNGNFAMIGAFRSISQMLSYAMPIVMSIVAVGMRAESLSMTQVIASQETLWNIVYMPLGFIVFYTFALALSFLPPFDLPVSGSELAGGVFSEYTGIRLAVIRIARLALILVLAQAIVVFFLGGWSGPLLPDWLWNGFKTFLVVASMLMVGRFLPRLRQDYLLEWSWKLGIPLALSNIFITGLIVIYL